MKKIFRYGVVSLAMIFGFILIGADSASAQSNSKAVREYRKDVKEARKDYNRRVRNGDRAKARREYAEDMRDARRDYVQNVRRDRTGYYWYSNGRRYHRPFSMWNYRNGYFYRKY